MNHRLPSMLFFFVILFSTSSLLHGGCLLLENNDEGNTTPKAPSTISSKWPNIQVYVNFDVTKISFTNTPTPTWPSATQCFSWDNVNTNGACPALASAVAAVLITTPRGSPRPQPAMPA